MHKPAPADHPLHDLISRRWSPLAFAPRSVPADALHSVFEAARWSPSAFNEQPWRFIVGTRSGGDSETFAQIVSCLLPGNQVWADTAPVLMIALAALTSSRDGRDNPYALYDTGQAVAHLTFQASALDLFVHQMAGFDKDKARETFAIPDTLLPVAAIALGYMGELSVLTDDKQRERHQNPDRARKPLAEIVFTGSKFGAPSPLLPPAAPKE